MYHSQFLYPKALRPENLKSIIVPRVPPQLSKANKIEINKNRNTVLICALTVFFLPLNTLACK